MDIEQLLKCPRCQLVRDHYEVINGQWDFAFDYDNKGEALSYLEPLLDKKEATVMIYHAVFGYTWKEIASELNLSESTVRNIYSDAKARLRKEYSRL